MEAPVPPPKSHRTLFIGLAFLFIFIVLVLLLVGLVFLLRPKKKNGGNGNGDRYNCDTDTGTCSKDDNGIFSSLSDCQSNCQKSNGNGNHIKGKKVWGCNATTHTCQAFPANKVSGWPKKELCEEECKQETCASDGEFCFDNKPCCSGLKKETDNYANCVCHDTSDQFSCNPETGECTREVGGNYKKQSDCAKACKSYASLGKDEVYRII